MIHRMKYTAAQLLKKSDGSYQQLVRTHSAITVGGWLVLFLLSFFVSFISPEGGLSNLGMQSMIFTAQIILILTGLFLIPFWETGLSWIAMDFVRGRRSIPGDLNEGFRCTKPILGSMVFQGIQYVIGYFLCSSAATVVLTLLPFSQAFYQDAEFLLQNPDTPLKGRMLIVATVYGIVFFSLLLCFLVFISLQYRMSRRVILDNEDLTGIKASAESRKLLKRRKKKLLALDLSFWWFYIPELLGILLPAAAILISGLELSLSPTANIMLWASAAFGLVLRLIIHFIAKPKVAASYALFYEQLITREEEPIVENPPQKASKKAPPKQVPWNYE